MTRRMLSRSPRTALAAAALAIVIAGVAVIAGTPREVGAAKGERPNIVVILSDDQEYTTLNAMPYTRARDDWVNFSNAMVNTALCCPSRATMLTGLTSSHDQIESNSEAELFKGQSTIADWLQADGYQTGFSGKYLNRFPWEEAENYVPDGWDYWVSYTGKQGYRDYSLNENGTVVAYDKPRDYSTDVFTDKAVEFIESTDSSVPFFSFVSYFGPHGPWTPPGRYVDAKVKKIRKTAAYLEKDVSDKPKWIRELPDPNRAKRRVLRQERVRHQRAMLAVDDGIRRIFEALAAKGELDNTIVVYTTDHGISLGNHRYLKKNCAHEACSRVPLVIRVPGVDGRREGALAGNIDFAPTFADYAGIRTGRPVDGRSLRPIIEGDRKRLHKTILLRRAQGAGDRKYWGLRTLRWKYVQYPKTGERELYDLRRDPYELFNLASTGRPKWDRKMRVLEAQLGRVRDTPPKIR